MIRAAVSSDIPDIVEMGQRFFDASGYGDFTSYDRLSAARTYEHLIGSPDGVIIVWEQHGALFGMAGALLYPFFFNANHRHGNEFFWWVEPEARGCAGAALMIQLERWARENGAQSFAMAALSSMRPRAVGRLYERAGYRASDATYIKRLDHADRNDSSTSR